MGEGRAGLFNEREASCQMTSKSPNDSVELNSEERNIIERFTVDGWSKIMPCQIV